MKGNEIDFVKLYREAKLKYLSNGYIPSSIVVNPDDLDKLPLVGKMPLMTIDGLKVDCDPDVKKGQFIIK